MSRNKFSEAYEQGLQRTIAFLISRGVPRDSAPDVAQAAWLRGWERLDQLRDEKMLIFWINQIALNGYRRELRSSTRETDWKPDYENAKSTRMNLAAIDIARILDSCNKKDRALLQDQIEGRTPKELADKEGVTPTAIRIRMFRVRRAIRTMCESPRQPRLAQAA